jgi:hypothetical protein
MRPYKQSDLEFVHMELDELNRQADLDDPTALDLGTLAKLTYYLTSYTEWGEIPSDEVKTIIRKSERLRDKLLEQAKKGLHRGMSESLVDEFFEHAGRLGEINARLIA